MEDILNNYPTSIKQYEKVRIIGKGAFGFVNNNNPGMGSKSNGR
jgi:hypothetical protein